MLDKWRYLQCGLVPSEDTSRMPLFFTIIPSVTGIKTTRAVTSGAGVVGLLPSLPFDFL